MAVTTKGNALLGVIQGMLETRGEGSTVTVEDISNDSDLSVASVRGTMSKLVKEGYLLSEAVENADGKKRKQISLTDSGWDHDVANYKVEAAE